MSTYLLAHWPWFVGGAIAIACFALLWASGFVSWALKLVLPSPGSPEE